MADYPRLATRTTCDGFRPIDVWHVTIMGFTQSMARPSGMEQLWSLLRNAHNNGRVNCSEPRPWNDNWDGLAELIFRMRPPGRQPRVFVYAYSWGAGWGFIRLAKALRRCGLEIQTAVLTDAVYRSPLLPTWLPLNPLSLLSAPTIRVPCNVREVHWFFQRTGWPRGHHVLASDPQSTTVHPGVECDCDHLHMDEWQDFVEQSMLVAEKATKETR